MQDLFMNPKLANVFPQFERGAKVQSVYSFAETERRVLEYLKNVLNGSVTGQGELSVKGKHKTVLRQVRDLQAVIEAFFNSMPSVAKNLRSNTKLYLPFATLQQLESASGYQSKFKAMKAVLENINYNPDFDSQNGVISNSPMPYQKRQELWKKKVGYKE